MPKDFYIRGIDDELFQAGTVEVNDEIGFILMQLEVLINTNPREILGQSELGFDLEQYIWTTVSNEVEIANRLEDQINQFVPLTSKYNIEVTVRFFEAKVIKYVVIDILIDGTPLISTILQN